MANKKFLLLVKNNYGLTFIIIILSLIGSFSLLGESRDYQNYLRYFDVLGRGSESEFNIFRLQIGFKYFNQLIYKLHIKNTYLLLVGEKH